MLGTDEFLQSVDVIQSLHPDVELSFDQYFSDSDESPVDERYVTAVVIAPYTEHETLSKDTGRDYIAEMDTCIEFVKQQVESI